MPASHYLSSYVATEEEFDQVQKMFRKDRGSIQSSCYENQKATHGKYFLPFRHLIKCSVCGHYMIPARNRGHSGTYYLNYRCHNKACTRPNNNVRMHVIMDQLYEEFGRISQKYDFTSFVDDMTEYANKKMQELSVEKHELLGQKTQKQRKIDDLAEKYAELDKESPKAVKDKLKKDMADLQNDVVNIDERIKQIETKIKNPEKLRMTIEKFSNSLNSLINRLEKGDLVEKDILVRNMVSNLEIDAQKRVIYRYKSPFNFIFEPEFSTGSPVGEPYVSYWSSESGKGSVEIIPSDEGYILKISGTGTNKYRFDISDKENEYHFEYYFDKDNNTVVINRLP